MQKIALALLLLIIPLFYPDLAFAAKRVEVNLSTQQLQAFDDQTVVYNFPVSSGRWSPTPTGTFYPWVKLRSTTMKGGDKAIGTYYNLPNVPYVVYFGNDQIPGSRGYALHGAYWHNNFGVPMSHGCVNVRPDQMSLLYNWMEMSTPIIIYGTTPRS